MPGQNKAELSPSCLESDFLGVKSADKPGNVSAKEWGSWRHGGSCHSRVVRYGKVSNSSLGLSFPLWCVPCWLVWSRCSWMQGGQGAAVFAETGVQLLKQKWPWLVDKCGFPKDKGVCLTDEWVYLLGKHGHLMDGWVCLTGTCVSWTSMPHKQVWMSHDRCGCLMDQWGWHFTGILTFKSYSSYLIPHQLNDGLPAFKSPRTLCKARIFLGLSQNCRSLACLYFWSYIWIAL